MTASSDEQDLPSRPAPSGPASSDSASSGPASSDSASSGPASSDSASSDSASSDSASPGPASSDSGSPDSASARPGAGAPVRGRRSRADRARQVTEVLRRQVASGAFPSGMLPDERTLIADFGVSRNTIREALGVLSDEGAVERRPGVGTVIRHRAYEHTLERLSGLAETLEAHGRVSNQVRVADVVRPPGEVARKLRVPDGESVVYIERLRTLGGVPLSLDLTYLAADIGIPLLKSDLAGRDLFSLIEESIGGRLGSASLSVQALNADAPTSALLEIPVGAAVFTVERLVRLPDGRPVDLEFLRIRGDRLAFRAELGRDAAPAEPGRETGPGAPGRTAGPGERGTAGDGR
ncbi:GntR family transcriptional regulator [Streptomyces sp. H27-D2]|nr:GntR family transcriptional regulator [Streptomyces sp. H27-D2]MEC4020984.1 GntR family transcriptional regulator [Streptomyces sp. H27-D2]